MVVQFWYSEIACGTTAKPSKASKRQTVSHQAETFLVSDYFDFAHRFAGDSFDVVSNTAAVLKETCLLFTLFNGQGIH